MFGAGDLIQFVMEEWRIYEILGNTLVQFGDVHLTCLHGPVPARYHPYQPHPHAQWIRCTSNSGRDQHVTAQTVSLALTTISQMITIAIGINPTRWLAWPNFYGIELSLAFNLTYAFEPCKFESLGHSAPKVRSWVFLKHIPEMSSYM